jgi:hypothetical protein
MAGVAEAMARVAMGTEAEEMVEDETEEPNEQRRPADEVEVAHTRYLHSSSSWRPPSACASRPLSCMASSSGGGEGVEWRRGGISWEWREGRLRRNRSSFEVTQKLVQGHAGPAKRGGAGCPEGGVPLDVALVRIVFVYKRVVFGWPPVDGSGKLTVTSGLGTETI